MEEPDLDWALESIDRARGVLLDATYSGEEVAAAHVARAVAKNLTQGYDAASTKTKTARTKREAELDKIAGGLRKKGDVALTEESIWDSITEDFGEAPQVELPGDGSGRGSKALPEAMTSDKPEETKGEADKAAEPVEKALENKETKSEERPKSNLFKDKNKPKEESEDKKAHLQAKLIEKKKLLAGLLAKKADVSGDVSEAKSEVVSPDTVDTDIKQPTKSVEEAAKVAKKKKADDVNGNISEAKSEVINPDTIDADIKQPTKSVAEAAKVAAVTYYNQVHWEHIPNGKKGTSKFKELLTATPSALFPGGQLDSVIAQKYIDKWNNQQPNKWKYWLDPKDANNFQGHRAADINGDISEAKSEVVSPDTVDANIKQPTKSIEEAAKVATGEPEWPKRKSMDTILPPDAAIAENNGTSNARQLALKLIELNDDIIYDVASSVGQIVGHVKHMSWFVNAVTDEIAGNEKEVEQHIAELEGTQPQEIGDVPSGWFYDTTDDEVFQDDHTAAVDNPDLDLRMEHIAKLVSEGYTSGHEPYWTIEFGDEITTDDVTLERIANLIREGYTSGYHPYWDLKVSPDDNYHIWRGECDHDHVTDDYCDDCGAWLGDLDQHMAAAGDATDESVEMTLGFGDLADLAANLPHQDHHTGAVKSASYTDRNFKTKKQLMEAVARGEQITIYNPGMGEAPTNGKAYIEGPHYPEPHRWYAQVLMKDGVIVKVAGAKTAAVYPVEKRGNLWYIRGLPRENIHGEVEADSLIFPGLNHGLRTPESLTRGIYESLYDEFQINDNLKKGDIFDTSVGQFICEGVHVLPYDEKAKAALAAANKEEENSDGYGEGGYY